MSPFTEEIGDAAIEGLKQDGNRGLARTYRGDNDMALADFNEAIRLDPKEAVP